MMGPPVRERLVAALGVLIGAMMILMKVVPAIPGHFTTNEWVALAIWIVLGALLARSGRNRLSQTST